MNLQESLGDNRKKVAVISIMVAAALIFLAAFFMPLNGPQVDDSSESGFNRADLMFMNMMIIHHDQAIEMAELAENRTDNENILELSENISEAQRAENRQMAEWLREQGYQRPRDGHRMAGMASEKQIQELRSSKGSQFDRKFAELMIGHHEGGIRMAWSFSRRGSHPELLEMEEEMIETQEKEIKKMQDWQKSWN
jgi:uncharacterized protein (DUF305 family)